MKRVSVIIGLAACAILASTTPLWADGIYCGLAKSRVEHLICGDQTLVAFDNQLDEAYQTTLAGAADQKSLIQSERNWLARVRNHCTDTACLTQSYQNRIAELTHVKGAGWETYHDATLGISFEYLANRQVKPCPSLYGDHCVALFGRDMTDSDYIIAFHVLAGSLPTVAKKEAGFDLINGRWVTTRGPGVQQNVEQISGVGWKGMKATIACGISDPQVGPQQGAGNCLWAVLSNGTHAVVADTQGVVGNDPATEHSVDTFQFKP